MATELGATAASQGMRVSVSMVTYHSAFGLLEKTLDGLERSVRHARERGMDMQVDVLVVDNSPSEDYRARVVDLCEGRRNGALDSVACWHTGRNIGYGAAHNQALERVQSDYHLILNPDVELSADALFLALDFLQKQEDVVIVSPRAVDGQGMDQYLCKRYPSVLVLWLRAFAPGVIKRRFEPYMHSYEIRDALGSTAPVDVPLVSGCCMVARTGALREAGGFSESFFMYFEDFDLSMRLQALGRLVFLPSIEIVHYGGYSARKGMRHISMFAESGWKFFRRHGWCWI